ncbi:DUF1499 domain-containing protein [Herpetosiphon geysericola]|uniref:DUF1499 domain-containing protein n=1 Tax=Herpetosiphon geysericola TaxID=70996 RepID=A0A0P6XNE9_9CHLR|nr:DUF1499 domain-containing protein [Herpetosiphon geysericola]KPL85147.1 hypothetical protein SE18_15715 [Herpetosiphon geysericola]
MNYYQDVFPWEVVVASSILLASMALFSTVRWIFRPQPKMFPGKRIVLFVVCLGLVFYAFRFVPNFRDKFERGLTTNRAATSDTPLIPELMTPRFSQDQKTLYEAGIRAIQAQRGWTITNRSDSQMSLKVDIDVMFGIFTDELTVAFNDEGGQTRVDIQSASKVGGADLGANRRHIRQLVHALEEDLGTPSQ